MGGSGPSQSHGHIIQPRTRDGRHQMLNHAHARAILGDHCAQPGLTHQVKTGGNFARPPPKEHALPGRCRRQAHGHGDAGVKRGAGGPDVAKKRISLGHGRLIAGFAWILIAGTGDFRRLVAARKANPMGQRFQAILLSLGLLMWGTAAWAVDLAKLPYRIGADGRVSTDVFVNGKGPYSFVLDTASSRTMLFEHLRQELGLLPADGSMLKVYAMNNIGTAIPVKPGALGLDKETIDGLTMGVLPDDVTTVGEQSADGILGMDALSHYFMVMDHDTLQVKLMDPNDPGATAYREWPSERLTPYQAQNMDITFWWMRAKFGGQTVTALLDMGSGITMVNWEAAEKLGLRRADFLKDKIPQDLRDALGTLEPVVLVKGLSIQVDDHKLLDQTVIVANAKVFQYFGLDDRPAAIIGPALLRSNSLAIDFGKRRIYIGPTTPEAVPAAHS